MSYIEFEKNELVNLKSSLSKEFLLTNQRGTYASSSIVFCNTRKYHGLLVPFLEERDRTNFVLLSALHESIVYSDHEFNLGINKYPFQYEPKGHKYITDYRNFPCPEITYSVGGVSIKKRVILAENEDQLLISYQVLEASKAFHFRLKPFMAFRRIHDLTHANMHLNNKFETITNGISIQAYPDLPRMYMQTSRKNKYVAAPDWYRDVEYYKEMDRGFDFKEDLFVPGFFELELKKGDEIIFSASLSESASNTLKRKFNKEILRYNDVSNLDEALDNAAKQFLVKRDNKSELIAGYPWFGRWGRDTFISISGLTLARGDIKSFQDIMNTMVSEMKSGLFPNIGSEESGNFHSVDAPLWYFWALQQYLLYTDDSKWIQKHHYHHMKAVLLAYREGTSYQIKMHDNGLIYSGEPGKALSWMDALVNEVPVTPRTGYKVEINALWYNALLFSLDLARLFGDSDFAEEWRGIPSKVATSILELFWDKSKGYLADVVDHNQTDWSMRPNQIFMCSLPNRPLTDDINKKILEQVRSELLTPKGLRTLSPKNKAYIGKYKGNPQERDSAYHQGTVWTWLLGHFGEAYLNLHGVNAIDYLSELYNEFESELGKAGIGSISEVYDGDPPYHPGGTISQAWSVAELIRMKNLVKKFKKEFSAQPTGVE